MPLHQGVDLRQRRRVVSLELDRAYVRYVLLSGELQGSDPYLGGLAMSHVAIKEAHTFFANHKAWLFVRKRVQFSHAYHIV